MVCLKALVIIVTLELMVFSIISTRLAKAVTPKISFYDWIIAVPALLVSGEMVFFSLLFCWAFSPAPYREAWKTRRTSTELMNIVPGRRMTQALMDCVDLRDFLMGLALSWRSPALRRGPSEAGKVGTA